MVHIHNQKLFHKTFNKPKQEDHRQQIWVIKWIDKNTLRMKKENKQQLIQKHSKWDIKLIHPTVLCSACFVSPKEVG